MKNVAVIGLGIMGHGIANNFLKNGYKVVVWNRTPDKADDLATKGATIASSVVEAVQQADYVFEVTANDISSREVWLGANGILSVAKPEQYLITCATLSTDWTDELASNCEQKQHIFFDMPMTGGRIGAESGQLTLLVGGSKERLANIADDLKAIAKDVKYFGKAGAGMRFKLILNALQAIHIAGLGEMLKMAKVAGLDQQLVGDALAERPGGVITNLAWDGYKNEPEPINFSVEWIAKDLDYAADMAKNVKHPLLDEAQKLYQQAIEQGFNQADWTKINKL